MLLRVSEIRGSIEDGAGVARTYVSMDVQVQSAANEQPRANAAVRRVLQPNLIELDVRAVDHTRVGAERIRIERHPGHTVVAEEQPAIVGREYGKPRVGEHLLFL